jgi:hypothetical protein
MRIEIGMSMPAPLAPTGVSEQCEDSWNSIFWAKAKLWIAYG